MESFGLDRLWIVGMIVGVYGDGVVIKVYLLVT